MKHAIRLAGLVLAFWAVVQVTSAVHSARTGGQHQDYKTYYFATHALAAGKSPYDRRVLCDLANTGTVRSFLYPPSSFIFFLPFRKVSYEIGADIFLLLKLAALVGLLCIWCRCFLDVDLLSWEWIVAAIAITQAFGRPILTDIREGNVSLFEQILIWSAFAGLLRQRYISFAIMIVLASVFKLLPIAFLGVLLVITTRSFTQSGEVDDRKYRLRAFWIGLLLFVTIQALGYALYPEHFIQALHDSSKMDERGFYNPSSLALFRDWVGVEAAWPIYVGWLLLILGITVYAVRKRAGGLTDVEWVMLSTLAFTLAAPRMKDYSYIVVLLPLAWMVVNVLRGLKGIQVALLVAVSWPFFVYQPLIGVGLLHMLFVGYLVTTERGVGPSILVGRDSRWRVNS